MQELCERRLEKLDFVALLIDGIHMGGQVLVVALGMLSRKHLRRAEMAVFTASKPAQIEMTIDIQRFVCEVQIGNPGIDLPPLPQYYCECWLLYAFSQGFLSCAILRSSNPDPSIERPARAV